jgi:tetratricopeptide (TPR) repeat protein
MPYIDFETFRTYLEEIDPDEVCDPTAAQLVSAQFWWEIGSYFLRFLDRRLEDFEPFEWYGHFLDKTIEALQYADELAQQSADNDFMFQTILPLYLAHTYADRGRLSMAEGAYDAAFLDFEAATKYHPQEEYQALCAEALSHLPSE